MTPPPNNTLLYRALLWLGLPLSLVMLAALMALTQRQPGERA